MRTNFTWLIFSIITLGLVGCGGLSDGFSANESKPAAVSGAETGAEASGGNANEHNLSSSSPTQTISPTSYYLVNMNGWLLQNSTGAQDFTDMHVDPSTGTWIWTDSASGSTDYIEVAYPGMLGVERAIGPEGPGVLVGFANPGWTPGAAQAWFPPNTMYYNAITLPVLAPSQMGTTGVTPGAVDLFPWEPTVEYQLNFYTCALQSGGNTLYTRNWSYLVANYPIGGTIGTPALTLIMETEQTTPTAYPATARLERYAFVPGYGRVWQEVGYQAGGTYGPGTRVTWNKVVPYSGPHFMGVYCPTN